MFYVLGHNCICARLIIIIVVIIVVMDVFWFCSAAVLTVDRPCTREYHVSILTLDLVIYQIRGPATSVTT